MTEKQFMQAAWYEQQGEAQKVIKYGKMPIPEPSAREVKVIINYKTEYVVERIREITGRERGINRIVDVNFSQNLAVADAVLRTNSAIAMYAANPDDAPALPILSLMMRNINLRTILVYTMPLEAKQAAIRDITKALEAGELYHNIAQTFPLSEVAKAHDLQDSGQAVGKVIIEIT